MVGQEMLVVSATTELTIYSPEFVEALCDYFLSKSWERANSFYFELNRKESLKKDSERDGRNAKKTLDKVYAVSGNDDKLRQLLQDIADCASKLAVSLRTYHEKENKHGKTTSEACRKQLDNLVNELSQHPSVVVSSMSEKIKDLALHAGWHAANLRAFWEGSWWLPSRWYLKNDAERDKSEMDKEKMELLELIFPKYHELMNMPTCYVSGDVVLLGESLIQQSTNNTPSVELTMRDIVDHQPSKSTGLSPLTKTILGAAVGVGIVLTVFLIIGLTPVGPIAGGLFAGSMGAALVSGSCMAILQSLAMTPLIYVAGAVTGAAVAALL